MRGVAFRVRREFMLLSGLERLREAVARPVTLQAPAHGGWDRLAVFTDPMEVRAAMVDRIDAVARRHLATTAADARVGRIVCFGRWTADYHRPIDWHRNPMTNQHWSAGAHWTQVTRDEALVGDIKATWEVARFPQAYHLARAAALGHEVDANGKALLDQIASFVSNNPFPLGVHWASGQEIAIRWMSFVFGLTTIGRLGVDVSSAEKLLLGHARQSLRHIRDHLDYARIAVYNNHVISEAVGLLLLGLLTNDTATQSLARSELDRQAEAQFYADGAYIQQSHNYHRVAILGYLYAWQLIRSYTPVMPEPWRRALDRSTHFLTAHQNVSDGRLPNYGSNDGSEPMLLSTCDFSDYRPALQAASVAVRGERLFEPGPWDEMTVWLHGAAALETPLRSPSRTSRSFQPTGYHVLRAAAPETFVTLRCGSLRDRFSQIDMLHVDCWWRGQNLFIDGGSYLYNAESEWHTHFMGTASHNAITIDGEDQMVHYRRFKVLYWTPAKLLQFGESDGLQRAVGEHYGYQRRFGVVHRRSVSLIDGDTCVIVDTLYGSGAHSVRLHWLCGDFPYQWEARQAALRLETPRGVAHVTVSSSARAVAMSVVRGQLSPIRGWNARYYGERLPTPSLVVEGSVLLPVSFLTVVSAVPAHVSHITGGFGVELGDRIHRFEDGVVTVTSVSDVATGSLGA